MATYGFYSFRSFTNPALRAASLGLLFPGAGLVAVCTIGSILSFIVSLALIPLVMFAWFGAGGVLFPALLWAGTAGLAALLAQDQLLEIAGPIWAVFCVAGIGYVTYNTFAANAEGKRKRQERNNYLISSVQENQANSTVLERGSRELDLETLRWLQWFIELGRTPKDDFSYHDVIDQFQTSAIRYQLYETVSDLGLYQYVYAPNFHGYVSAAQRNIIEKSLTEKVVGFWKWETLWGKFKLDFDPIKEDDIMVSGYVLQAVGIYQSNTGDERYSKPGSLVFEVDKTHKYAYDFRSIAEAVQRNWDNGPYCLFSCEPNWIYTLCNLVGVSGQVLASRLLNRPYAESMKERFREALETEFSTTAGSILPIRSELTGFTLPGLAGALSDGINSILCAAYLPAIAHRNWAFTKKESITWIEEKDGSRRAQLNGLIGADKLDPGNYRAGVGAIRAVFAAAAAEFGDEDIRIEMLRQLDEEFHPAFTTSTGARKNKGLSTIEQGSAMRGRLGRYQDWVGMVRDGPEKNVRDGPILDRCEFPDVLVAKCFSKDGKGLDMVVYNGKSKGTFKLGFTRLQSGARYELTGSTKNGTVQADVNGEADWDVYIDGRTELQLKVVG